MKVTDTLILEDRMSQTIKAVKASLENASKATIVAKENLDKLKNTQGATTKEINNATKEWAKQSESAYNLQKKLNSLEKAQEDLNEAMQQGNKFSNKAVGLYAGLGSAVGNIASNMLMQAGQMLSNSIGQAIETASDLVEVQNVVDTTFGNNAKIINEWSQNALTQFGLNELSAKKFTSTLGAMMKSSGITGDALVEMSTKMAGLAGDMASFYNLDPEEAFTKIRAGISGESEPLKQIGIDMTEATLKADAMALGFGDSLAKLTQQQKILVRYHSLLRQTADSQGDAAETMYTFANQQRILSQNWGKLTAKIAEGFLPALTNLYILMNKLISYTINNIPKFMQMVQTAGIFIGTAIAMIIPYFIALKAQAISTFFVMKAEAIKTALATAGAWMVANAPILIALGIIGAVSLALKAMGISFNQQAKNIITSFFMVGNVIQNVGIIVANFFRSIYNGVINTINLIRKLKGEAPLQNKKQYTQLKDVYWDSVTSTDKLLGKTKGITEQFNMNSGINKALDKVTEGGALKTKQQGKIELQEEDIELLSQLATRDWTIRSQTLAPNIQFGAVTVNENADIGQFINELNNSVAEMANNNLNVGVGK